MKKLLVLLVCLCFPLLIEAGDDLIREKPNFLLVPDIGFRCEGKSCIIVEHPNVSAQDLLKYYFHAARMNAKRLSKGSYAESFLGEYMKCEFVVNHGINTKWSFGKDVKYYLRIDVKDGKVKITSIDEDCTELSKEYFKKGQVIERKKIFLDATNNNLNNLLFEIITRVDELIKEKDNQLDEW